MKKTFLPVALSLALLSTASLAWDGTDSSTGDSVEIERGNLVRSGRDIEYLNVDRGDRPFRAE